MNKVSPMRSAPPPEAALATLRRSLIGHLVDAKGRIDADGTLSGRRRSRKTVQKRGKNRTRSEGRERGRVAIFCRAPGIRPPIRRRAGPSRLMEDTRTAQEIPQTIRVAHLAHRLTITRSTGCDMPLAREFDVLVSALLYAPGQLLSQPVTSDSCLPSSLQFQFV